VNQLTLEIESKNLVISTKDQTFLNKDEEPRIRPQIRECMKRIETVVRKRAINPTDGMLFRLSILCWKESTQVHVQFAYDDEDDRRSVERDIDAIVALMTGTDPQSNEAMLHS